MRFKHPVIQGLASKYDKEPAQILLRYSLQKGFVALPKSASKHRIESNTKIFDFELTEEEMNTLDGLDEGTPLAAHHHASRVHTPQDLSPTGIRQLFHNVYTIIIENL